MNILIGDFDLFNSVGGGQTVYRRLIETNPHLAFYYFIDIEDEHSPRPANAHVIRYKKKYNNLHLLKHINDLEPSIFSYYDFSVISNMAYSVAGRSFDVFDTPDYYRFGYFTRPALRAHNVAIGKIVLAMHGNLSTTNYLNWHEYHVHRYDHELCEQWQYRSVDVRYGISEDYIDEWFGLVPIRAHYLNPNKFFDFPAIRYIPDSSVKPDLNFIGRTEKRKGPDIFCEIAAAIPRHLYNQANIIGPDDGMGSNQYVEQYIVARSYDMNMLGLRSYAELQQIFARPSITILPSRYDTLNLVALESLLSGCPTVIGAQAGVIKLLKDTFPNVPFVTVYQEQIPAAVRTLSMILENYDAYRNSLIEELKRTVIDKVGIELAAIYAATSEYIASDFELHERWYKQFLAMHEGMTSYEQRPITITAGYQNLLNADGIYSHYRENSGNYYNSYIQIAKATEDTEQQINKKLEALWKFSEAIKVDRVRVWNALSKLERMKGNHTLAATYQLRIMRSQGVDLFGALPYVKETLYREDFPNEANVAEFMFAGGARQHEQCLEYLDSTYQKHLLNGEFDHEFVERHNYTKSDYKVTVIVSMYNAANKLKNFISRLQSQTLFNDQAIEVIFVETGSPAGDYAVFRSILHLIRFPVTYARTVKRETIQSAWNRGISLSRGEYLSFLGVDETIAPRCFEILLDELERDQSLDWIIGNSLVTEVDDNGAWIRDVMMYNRTGYHQDIVYLETCYLSWVGALYRKSIHQRFGFYDASFRAAGDTEFKSRILPHIKSKVIPLTLGFFMNYADERTTESPRAEIEDLRAWYLYRTSAGAEYVYRNRTSDDIGNSLIRALHYRKSYKNQMSSDVDFAVSLSTYLAKAHPVSAYLKMAEGLLSLQESFRAIDFIKHLSPDAIQGELDCCMAMAAAIEKQHRDLGICCQHSTLLYGIFNDNRYEQHFWPWTSDVTTLRKTADKLVWL